MQSNHILDELILSYFVSRLPRTSVKSCGNVQWRFSALNVLILGVWGKPCVKKSGVECQSVNSDANNIECQGLKEPRGISLAYH